MTRVRMWLPALLMLIVLPALAGEPGDDPLEGLAMAARAQIRFLPGMAQLSPESRSRLQAAIAKTEGPGCFWIAEGRNEDEAETLKASLAEHDIAVEAIAIATSPSSAFAEVRLYCSPPPQITAYFMPGMATLTGKARRRLSIAAAGYWNLEAPLVVRGYAGAKETSDPLQLGLDRARAARDFLIAHGFAPKRLTIEANTKATGRDSLRVEIMPRSL